jgi:hypothetical protein
MREPLTAELLNRMYTIEGMSDTEIAKTLKYDRTAIVYARQRHGIATRLTTGRLGELLVLKELSSRFGKYNVIDMNETDATSIFDILLKEDIRIEVKTSKVNADSHFTFNLSNKKGHGILENEITKLTKGGRTIKDLSKTCDYVILVFIEKSVNYLILPSNTPTILNRNSKSIGGEKLREISKHFNKWEILGRSITWESYLRTRSLGRSKKKSY